jgi:hypothetical protein
VIGSRRETLPLPDAASLRPAARRTTIVRLALALALVGLVLAAAQLGRERHVERASLLPADTSGILVLDVSASISTDTYDRIRATLESLSRGQTPFGLVVFSDVAYEALPPGTPASELAPFVRYFRVREPKPGFAPQLPTTPWSRAFTGGTKISAGLSVARTVLADNRTRRGAVLLVSDLSDDPKDTPRVAQEIVAYERTGIALRVVGLNPSLQDAALFRRLLGSEEAVIEARLPGEGELEGQSQVSSSFPTGLVAAACAVFLLLAANELWGARLSWARTA